MSEPYFWGSPEQEHISATSRDDAIESILDDLPDPLPEKITIAGFDRAEINLDRIEILSHLLERLDEDYGDIDGDASEPTQKMKDAERAFLAVVKAEYEVWACKEVCREEVNVAEWIKENRPDWIEKSAT